MNDRTRREDFDKKLVLPNVMMLKNIIHNEMKLGGSPRFIHLLSPVPKPKQTNKNKNPD